MVDVRGREGEKYFITLRKVVGMFYDTLVIEYGSCPPECQSCEQTCITKRGKSGIRVLSIPEVEFHGIVKCNQCTDCLAAESCPTAALTREDGIVTHNEERCIGCGICTLACTYGGINYDDMSRKAFKCDNCQGKPECVDVCEHGVLQLSRSLPFYNYLGEDRLAQGLSFCAGCGTELTIRMALRILGENVIAFSAPGCGVFAFIAQLRTGESVTKVPFCAGLMTNIPSLMTGVKRYFSQKGQEVTCVAFVGDGLTSDVGFQPLSGAAERGENLVYICLDNEAYMNTGVQRSSRTPLFARTTTSPLGKITRGKQREPKDIPLIMTSHHIPYVATATIAFAEDFAAKLEKAKKVKSGLAYIHVFSPCPTGWSAATSETIELSKLAVETGYFPLWEAEDGRFKLTYEPKDLRPLQDFTGLTGRYAHLNEEEQEVLTRTIRSRLNYIKQLIEAQKTVVEV